MESPSILFIGRWDWANICNRVARAINEHVGHRVARVATEHAHSFGYDEDVVIDRDGLEVVASIARDVDWIITTGDGEYGFVRQLLAGLPLKSGYHFGVTHAGTAYRGNSRLFNRYDDELGAKVRFIGSDSWYLANGDPRAVPYFGSSESMSIPIDGENVPTVSHSPSSRATKGTDLILPVLRKLESDGVYRVSLIENVSAGDAIRRRAATHVYVDQMKATIGGFGQAAIEGMGAGCVVLCDINKVVEDVWLFYPRPPIIPVRTPDDLERALILLARDRELMMRYRKLSYDWSIENSSPAAIARYWLGHLARAANLSHLSRTRARTRRTFLVVGGR